MTLFPMFLKMKGRPCLVVGAGTVAEAKIRSLMFAGASIQVVAPRAAPAVIDWAQSGQVRWEARTFVPADLEGMFLVIAAASSLDVNDLVFCEAQRRGVLCNVVDNPERCDFYYPAVVRRGSLQIAVSTGGRSPALAERLRRELEHQFGPEYAGWVESLGRDRKEILARTTDREYRRRVLRKQAGQEAFEAFRNSLASAGED
jgi:precorrin-2 dehydrogenase